MPVSINLITTATAVVVSAAFASAVVKGLVDTVSSLIRERISAVARKKDNSDVKVISLNVESLKRMSNEIDDLKNMVNQLIETNQQLTVKLERSDKPDASRSPLQD